VIALFDNTLWSKFAQHTEAILAELDRLGMAIDRCTEAQIAEQDWVKLTQLNSILIAISDGIWVVPLGTNSQKILLRTQYA
jgi:ribosomal protein L11 methyltransferase